MLPNVFIFEGGDICGKTTQVKIASKKMKDSCTFKFPNRQIDIPRSELNIDQFKKCFPLDDIFWIDENNHFRIDIYFDIFQSLHNFIYTKPIEEIMEDIEYIENLIICDISANGYDKYSWVKKIYFNICENNLYKNIIIDRFTDSGTIYNTRLPIDYIWSLHPSTEQSKLLNQVESRIRNWDSKVTGLINDTIENVNLICTKGNIDPSLVKESRFSDVLYDQFNFAITNKIFENFVTYYFDNSEILYIKTKESVNNGTVNREISDYDKNIRLRYLIKKEFDKFKTLESPNRINVPTDLIISQTKTPEEFYEEMTKL